MLHLWLDSDITHLRMLCFLYKVKNFQCPLGFVVLFFHVLLFTVLQCLPVMASSEGSVPVKTSSKEHKAVSLRSSFCQRASMLTYLCIMELVW